MNVIVDKRLKAEFWNEFIKIFLNYQDSSFLKFYKFSNFSIFSLSIFKFFNLSVSKKWFVHLREKKEKEKFDAQRFTFPAFPFISHFTSVQDHAPSRL